jgi:hypothetical protein
LSTQDGHARDPVVIAGRSRAAIFRALWISLRRARLMLGFRSVWMYVDNGSILAGSTFKFGMVLWGVCNHAFSAMIVIPGVLAITSNVGAFGFGERPCPASIAWQAAQFCTAYARPSTRAVTSVSSIRRLLSGAFTSGGTPQAAAPTQIATTAARRQSIKASSKKI